MRIDLVTLFPGMFDSVLGSSILKRAAQPVTKSTDSGAVRPAVVSYHLHDPRAYTTDRHSKVDQSPYGGGPGMVLQCQPIFDCVLAAEAEQPERKTRRIVMTPKGVPLTQPLAEELAQTDRLLIIAGHYEGFDQRVLDELEPLEISLGDYVLTGGELPAMVLLDSIVRLLPGALGDAGSAHRDSFSPGSCDESGQRLLDCPHYTRPPEWRGRAVPPVLLSGDHAKIESWRREQAMALTLARRPDLLAPAPASCSDAAVSNASRTQVVVLRDALPCDHDVIDRVLTSAFPSTAEAKLVSALRSAGDLPIEVVAEVEGRVVGHVAFSPLTIEPVEGFGNPRFRSLALAPLAVDPAHQNVGIGKVLARYGLRLCNDAKVAAVFVLGDPPYYAPLGFEAAGPHGYSNPYTDGPAFQVCFLNATEREVGLVKYAPAFDELAGSP